MPMDQRSTHLWMRRENMIKFCCNGNAILLLKFTIWSVFVSVKYMQTDKHICISYAVRNLPLTSLEPPTGIYIYIYIFTHLFVSFKVYYY